MPKIKSSSSSSSSVSKHEGGEKERKKRAKREKKEERERRKRHEKKAAKSKKDDGLDSSSSDKKKKRRSRMLLRKKKKKETAKQKTEAGNKKDGEETETESEWETDDDDSSVATGSEASDVSDAEELSSDSSFTDSGEFETNDEASSASSSSVSSSSSSSTSASSLTHEVEKETKTKSHSRTRSSVALPEEKTSSTSTAAANTQPEIERAKEIEKRGGEEMENRYQQQQRRSNEERRQHYEKEPQRTKMKIVDDDSFSRTRGNGEFGQLSVDNFGCFIFCKDTIDEMSLQVKQTILSSHQGLPKLEMTYAELITKADRIFGSLLERKKEADTKRNVLAALQRYRFVFDLPIRIKEHIQAEEFDKVVRDYNRAKTHLSQTNVGIFKQVLVEVEKLVENFRAELYRRLDDISATSPEEQENIIRLLGELKSEEDKEDPAWQYLKSLQHRISEQLSASASANREDRRKSVTLFASMAKQRPVMDEEENMMAKCNQIAEYSRVLMTYLPSFWKIHAFYLASTFAAKGERSKPSAAIKHKKEVEQLAKEIVELYASRIRSLFAAIVNEEAKIAATHVSSRSQSTAEEEQEDTEHTKEATDNNTRRKTPSQQRESAASQLEAHGDQTRPNVRQNRTRLDKTNRKDKKQNEERRSIYLAMLLLCVEEVKKCFEGLKELKMPRAYMEGIYEVLHDFTRTYIDATANHFIHIISRLGEEERWEVEQIDFGDILGFNHLLSERRSDSFLVKTTTTSEALGEPTTGFMHTTLPSLFMTKLTYVLQMQFQGLGIGSIHTATLEEPSLASLVLDFQVAAFQTFQETLQRLAKEVFSTNVEGSEEDDDTVEKKLVLVLGNCTFTRNQVVPQIFELLYSLFHGNDSAAKRELAQTYLQDSMKKINSSMEQLEEWLIDAFVQQKSNNLISIIRNGLLHTPISAKHLSVSNYVIQLLLQLVNVHHQLSSSSSSFSSSSSLTRKERKNSSTSILSRLVDHVFNAFLSSLRDLDKGEGSNGVATLLSSSSSPSSSSALSSADTSTKEWGKQKLQLSSEDLHAKKKDSKKKAVNDPKAILLQIERDVRFVEGVMRNYIDDDAKSYLRSLDGLLEKWYARFGDLSASARKKATKGALLENAKSKTWLLFSCF